MNKKILLVEDDLPVRELYKRVLERGGYKVVEAVDGEEGLKIIQEFDDLDLVLLDIMLPKMDGIEMLRRVRKEDKDKIKNIPVILLTNLGQESIIEEAFRLGAEGYLIKVRLKPKEIVEEVDAFFSQAAKETDKN